jgi:hypothetical protein
MTLDIILQIGENQSIEAPVVFRSIQNALDREISRAEASLVPQDCEDLKRVAHLTRSLEKFRPVLVTENLIDDLACSEVLSGAFLVPDRLTMKISLGVDTELQSALSSPDPKDLSVSSK